MAVVQVSEPPCLCLRRYKCECVVVGHKICLSPQYLPVPEVPGSLGTGAAGRLCTGIQV